MNTLQNEKTDRNEPLSAGKQKELVRRYGENPIITIDDFRYKAHRVCNSGFVEDGEGGVIGLIYVSDREIRPHMHYAHSADGIHFDIDEDRSLCFLPDEFPYKDRIEGIYDPRITRIEDWYYITHNTGSEGFGTRISLHRTRDFRTVEPMGFISPPDNRNCVLFPERINGDYVRLERPHGLASEGDIYISFSPDLIHWGRHQLLYPRNYRRWESVKVGAGAPPIKTEAGWLAVYHAARGGCSGHTYSAGCMLLDLEDPTKIIGKMDEYLFQAEAPYELTGLTSHVVFPTGLVRHGEGDELKIYYGAADWSIALATARESDLVEACLSNPYSGPQGGRGLK